MEVETMRRQYLIVLIVLMEFFLAAPVLGQWGLAKHREVPTQVSPPELGFDVSQRGWLEAPAENDELWAWTREDGYRMSWQLWQPIGLGSRWKLGAEEARLIATDDGGLLLGLERQGGRALVLHGPNNKKMTEEMMTLATSLSHDGTVWRTIGYSVENRPIDCTRIGSGPNKTLFFGIFHGDEPAGEPVLRRLAEYLVKNPDLLEGRTVEICPVLNPDGLARKTRVNARLVDVNRNFPAKNWIAEGEGTRYWGGPKAASEPETLTVIKLLEDFAPNKIVTLHATLHNVNYDGPAQDLAKRMSALNGYVVEPDIGYPTPGSFGTFVGRERKIPTITLEFPEGEGEAMWQENKQALLEAIRYEVKE